MRLLLLAPLLLISACGSPRSSPPKDMQRLGEKGQVMQELRQAQLQRERNALESCLRERPELEAQMVSLRRAEAELARVKQEGYVPLPPPEPWNEARESRYRLEDREADWQRYLQAQEDWKRREEQHRSSWHVGHQSRLQEAQATLDRVARELRSRRPNLFTGPGSIEFNADVVSQIRSCRAIGMGR